MFFLEGEKCDYKVINVILVIVDGYVVVFIKYV